MSIFKTFRNRSFSFWERVGLNLLLELVMIAVVFLFVPNTTLKLAISVYFFLAHSSVIAITSLKYISERRPKAAISFLFTAIVVGFAGYGLSMLSYYGHRPEFLERLQVLLGG